MKKGSILLLLVLLLAGNMHAKNTQNENTLITDNGKIIVPIDEDVQELPPSAIFKQIVSTDNRIEITGRAEGILRATVIIEENDGTPRCSGAMIAPNIVLTAAHCLIDKNGPLKNLTVLAVGMPAFKPTNAKSFSLDKPEIGAQLSGHITEMLRNQYMAKQNRVIWPAKYEEIQKKNNWNFSWEATNYDYGFIILDTNLGEKTGWFGAKPLSDTELKNKDIAVIGKGYDKQKRTLWYSSGKIGGTEYVQNKRFSHNCDILGGNSGSPTIATDNPEYIIGVHVAERPDSEYQNSPESYPYPNIAKRVTEDVIQTINSVIKEYSAKK